VRKELYRMDRGEALRLLAHAPVVRLATTTGDGAPVLRTVHAAVVDGYVAFHGAPAGEKVEALGREAVVGAEEIIAPVPSTFVDPERACPATTYYRSVQVHGRLEAIEEPARKAAVLATLMAKHQPEGGHAPIDAASPLYRKAIEGLLVVGVALERVDGKAKLGQNRTPAELGRVLEGLWARGLEGDPRAIELVLRANPAVPPPAFLAGPGGVRLACALEADAASEAADLLADAYWNVGVSRSAIAAAHLASAAWVGACEGGALVATARAMSDRAKTAWIYDVMIAPERRGRGLGAALVRLLLDHPAVRGARRVRLGTRDARAFYAALGFRVLGETPSRGHTTTEMELRRE
jgi:nitroimidazol reductase NimA-like FMN-containing flavoprotein (pyridoxamine 5'-phosphate oxidase superfamily)/ribosomal protein S18 acetylase RimI-like enzyme